MVGAQKNAHKILSFCGSRRFKQRQQQQWRREKKSSKRRITAALTVLLLAFTLWVSWLACVRISRGSVIFSDNSSRVGSLVFYLQLSAIFSCARARVANIFSDTTSTATTAARRSACFSLFIRLTSVRCECVGCQTRLCARCHKHMMSTHTLGFI